MATDNQSNNSHEDNIPPKLEINRSRDSPPLQLPKKEPTDFYDIKMFEQQFGPWMRSDVIFEERRINFKNAPSDSQDMVQQMIVSPDLNEDSSHRFVSPHVLTDHTSPPSNRTQLFGNIHSKEQKITEIDEFQQSYPMNMLKFGSNMNSEQTVQIHGRNRGPLYDNLDLHSGSFNYEDSQEMVSKQSQDMVSRQSQDAEYKDNKYEKFGPSQIKESETQKELDFSGLNNPHSNINVSKRGINMNQFTTPNMTVKDLKQREYEQNNVHTMNMNRFDRPNMNIMNMGQFAKSNRPAVDMQQNEYEQKEVSHRNMSQFDQSNINVIQPEKLKNIEDPKFNQINRNEASREHGPAMKDNMEQSRNGMYTNFNGYEMPFYDSHREPFQENTSNQHENIQEMGQSNSNFFMNNAPSEMFRPFHNPRPYQDLEQPLYVNAHQFNCIRRRKIRRDFLDSITANKNSLSYLHESRHRHAMNRLRAPSGRFLTKEEAEEMRAKEKDKQNDER